MKNRSQTTTKSNIDAIIARITSPTLLNGAGWLSRRAIPLFSGAIEQRAGLSFGTFLFPAEKKSTSRPAGYK